MQWMDVLNEYVSDYHLLWLNLKRKFMGSLQQQRQLYRLHIRTIVVTSITDCPSGEITSGNNLLETKKKKREIVNNISCLKCLTLLYNLIIGSNFKDLFLAIEMPHDLIIPLILIYPLIPYYLRCNHTSLKIVTIKFCEIWGATFCIFTYL